MSDDDLITAVRAQRDKVPMTVPVEEIISRGRSVRARRRIPGMAGALAVAGGAAVAAATLLPGHSPGPVTARLTAWTVTKQTNGTVTVTLRELRDPAGLQRTLRADGVPASVTFFNHQNPACQPYPPGTRRGEAQRQTIVAPVLPVGGVTHARAIVRPASITSNSLIIDPSLLPRGVGLQIGAGPVQHDLFRIWAGLVRASQQCTGS